MRRLAPVLVLLATLAVGSACSGGEGGGSPARVAGLVLDDETGLPLGGASVTIGGANATSGNDGRFVVTAAPGEHPLAASATDYHPIDTRLLVASGDNELKLRLVPCDPLGDVACPPPVTPTPTATPLGTPTDANVFAEFDGVNPVLTTAPNVPAWTGMATVNGIAFGTRFLGDGDTNDYAYCECWLDANHNVAANNGDARAEIDHCDLFFFGFNDGPIAGPDAAVVLYVPGPEWVDDAVLRVGVNGVTLRYVEGTMTTGYGINENYTEAATEGVIRLQRAGYYAPQPVTLTTGAFLVPNLP